MILQILNIQNSLMNSFAYEQGAPRKIKIKQFQFLTFKTNSFACEQGALTIYPLAKY